MIHDFDTHDVDGPFLGDRLPDLGLGQWPKRAPKTTDGKAKKHKRNSKRNRKAGPMTRDERPKIIDLQAITDENLRIFLTMEIDPKRGINICQAVDRVTTSMIRNMRAETMAACGWSLPTYYRKLKNARGLSRIETYAITQIVGKNVDKLNNSIKQLVKASLASIDLKYNPS